MTKKEFEAHLVRLVNECAFGAALARGIVLLEERQASIAPQLSYFFFATKFSFYSQSIVTLASLSTSGGQYLSVPELIKMAEAYPNIFRESKEKVLSLVKKHRLELADVASQLQEIKVERDELYAHIVRNPKKPRTVDFKQAHSLNVFFNMYGEMLQRYSLYLDGTQRFLDGSHSMIDRQMWMDIDWMYRLIQQAIKVRKEQRESLRNRISDRASSSKK